LWSQTTIRPSHLGERGADRAGLGDVVERRHRQRQVEAVVVEGELLAGGSDALHVGRLAREHVEHPLGGIDAGHLEAAARQPLGEDPGPAADVEPAARRAALGDEGDPLVEIVLDDVRGERLVVLVGDQVEVALTHRRRPARPGAARP
jgi:hypothetical protein